MDMSSSGTRAATLGKELWFSDRMEAIRVARHLVENLRVDSGQAAQGNINPAELAQHLGVDVRQAVLDDATLPEKSAAYVNSMVRKWADSSDTYIVINMHDGLPTQRFSIAHEVGHLVWRAYEASGRAADIHITPDYLRELLKDQTVAHTRRKHNRPQMSDDRHDFNDKDEAYFSDPALHVEYLCDLFANFWLLPNDVLPEIASMNQSVNDKASDLAVSVETLSNGMEYYAMSLTSTSEVG